MKPDLMPDVLQPQTAQSRKLANARSAVSLALCCIFLGTGASKLTSVAWVVETFRSWGYPTWFRYAIGVVELAAAILVLIPATRALGAALIAVVMIGALGTHLVAGQWTMLAVPLVLLVLAVLLISALRPRFEPRSMSSAPSPET